MLHNTTTDAIRSRQAVRSFSETPVSDELICELLELADRAPSGFNLQPWQFVVVKDPTMKQLLYHIAMEQKQVLDAPATVVFVANPRAWKENYRKILQLGLDSGVMPERQVKFYRRNVRLLFQTAPLGIFGLLKRLALPVMRFFHPVPNLITTHQEAAHYVRAQTMLAAGTFMLAARSAGLDTSPMEGFDEYRLKKLLNIPSFMTVPIIIALGHRNPEHSQPMSIRLPLAEKCHFEKFRK